MNNFGMKSNRIDLCIIQKLHHKSVKYIFNESRYLVHSRISFHCPNIIFFIFGSKLLSQFSNKKVTRPYLALTEDRQKKIFPG